MARILTIVVFILVVVAAVRLAGREEQRVPRSPSKLALPEAAAPIVDAGAFHAVAPPAAPPVAPPPAPAVASLEGPCADLRGAVSSKVASGIESRIGELLARIDGNVERALEVVSTLSKETDPDVLFAVADALSRDPRIADARELVEAFLEMALRDSLPDRRMAALAFLGERPRGEAMEAQFLGIALGDPDSLVRTEAVYSLQRQARVAPEACARLNATLLRAAISSDACVRAPAVEALSMREADDAQLSSVIGYLREDEDVAVRIAAMDKLGEVRSGHRERALREIEDAYGRDAEVDVRYVAILAAVRAGRAEALPILRRMSGLDPALDPVVERFTTVLSTGEVDLDAILEEVARLEGGTLPPMSPVDENAPCCEGHE